MRIEVLLELTDYELWEMFEDSTTCRSGSEIRKELECRRAHGDVFLGTANCEGFSPVTGCPGHEAGESVDELPCTALIIVKELENKKRALSSILITDMAKKAAYQDAINIIREIYKRELEVSNG